MEITIIQDVRDMKESLDMDYGYYLSNGMTKAQAMTEIVKSIPMTVWTLIAIQICKYKGHDLEDHGYAGPDHGEMDMYCKRCGESWRHVLY